MKYITLVVTGPVAHCGHQHKSIAIAQHCLDHLTRSFDDGWCSATWYHARIEDNATHQSVDLYA
jgi:hypothetical protein